MSKYESSLIYIQNTPISAEFIGSTGPTGPTGPKGNTGSTGSTGNTGNGIGIGTWVRKLNSDGITIYLLNGSSITLTGLSGNAAVLGSLNPDITHYGITGATGSTSTSIVLSGKVSGLTSYFNNLFTIDLGGMSVGYQGSDILFVGLTSSIGFFESNIVLQAGSNHVYPISISYGKYKDIFSYVPYTSGITTTHVSHITVSNFLQSSNSTGITNLNSLNISGVTAYIKNFANTSISSLYISGGIYYNKQFYNSSYKDVKGIFFPVGAVPNSGITSISNVVFRTTNVTNYNLQEFGSCCWCSANKQCVDYVTRGYCNSIVFNGFSKDSCNNRKINGDNKCLTFGACCKGGFCANITEAACTNINGIFTSGTSCAGTVCS